MVIKQRAMADEDKEERRSALLDAAEALFLQHPERMVNVAEVAQAAGLAKGTVYLYFPSKEEIFLALHERHVARFFSRLIALLDATKAAGFDEVWALTREVFVRVPGCLPLTSRCFGLMDRDMPQDAAIAFKIRVAQGLAAAGAGLEKQFPALGKGEGVTLLQHSYGLILGLWQLMHPIERFGSAMERAELTVFKRDYERELEQALRALWAGTMERKPVRAGKGKSR